MMRKTRAARSPFGKGTESLRRYTVWSIYALIIASPLFLGIIAARQTSIDPLSIALVISHIALSTSSTLCLHDATNKLLKHIPIRRWVGVALAAAIVACYILSIGAADIGNPDSPVFSSEILLLSFSLTATGFMPILALTPILPTWQLLIFSTLSGFSVALGVAAPFLLHGANILNFTNELFSLTLFNAIIYGIIAALMRWSFAVLAAVSSQEQVDAVKADLAVAEERLRIARDLHDLFGRTLTAVALKSELTAALAEKENAPKAAAEALRVKALADDALKEVRAVLAEYRRPDLRQELAGAISLLASAGIPTRIIGEREAPRWAEEYLALVLREGATNIVRHSAATHADIRLNVTESEASITLTNDQAHTKTPSTASPNSTAPATPSSGLDSLRARIAEVGGTLTTEQLGHIFSLTARIPALAHSQSREDTP